MITSFLQFLVDNDGVMTAIGAFGFVPLGIIAYVLHKIGGVLFSETTNTQLKAKWIAWVTICWLVGFMSQIIMQFMYLNPLHRFFIYVSMLLLVFIAVFTNSKTVEIYDILKEKADKSMHKGRRR